MTITNIHFDNFWGIASKQNDPKVGTLICSSPEVSYFKPRPKKSILTLVVEKVCSKIFTKNITVTPPSGKSPEYICTNVSLLAFLLMEIDILNTNR
jgi:galacturan 1,4-alpha-galacturonidase